MQCLCYVNGDIEKEIQQVDTPLLSYCLRKVQHSIFARHADKQIERNRARPVEGYSSECSSSSSAPNKTFLLTREFRRVSGFVVPMKQSVDSGGWETGLTESIKAQPLSLWRAFKLKND